MNDEPRIEPLGPLRRNDEGVPVLDVPPVKCVTVADLAEVVSHSIVERFGSVSHHIRFRSGGQVRFAYTLAGELLQLNAENVRVMAFGDGTVVFSMRSEEEMASADTEVRAWRVQR